MGLDNQEYAWFLYQKARVKGARAHSTLFWFEKGRTDRPRGYYIVWTEKHLVGDGFDVLSQWVGIGDARTQVNIENWITKHRRR